MPSYLSTDDIAQFGVEQATPAQIAQACALVDSYLLRPEGLLWAPDAAGAPCYMAGNQPTYSIQSSAAFGPGSSVTVSVPMGSILQDKIGCAVVVDRAEAELVEACVIQSTAPGSITFTSVSYAHEAGATIDFGLLIEEERSLPSKRPITRASRGPLLRLVAGVGRYAMGRRSDQIQGLYSDANLLAVIQTFGGPPMWVPWDPNQASISTSTGEIWVPAGQLLAYYSEVRLWYVAGWTVDQIPTQIKVAVANIANAAAQFPDLGGGYRSLRAGDTQVQRFKDTMIDGDTRALLDPFKVKVFG